MYCWGKIDCNVRVMVGGSAVSSTSYHKSHLTGQANGTFGADNGQSQNSLIWMPDFDNETNAKTKYLPSFPVGTVNFQLVAEMTNIPTGRMHALTGSGISE